MFLNILSYKLIFMKKKILYLIIISGFYAQGQVKVGNNPTTITASAVLEVESTTKGFLPPRVTLAQRTAIATPVAGLTVYCTDCAVLERVGELQVYNGTKWTNINGGTAMPGIDANCDTNATAVQTITSSTGVVWMDRNLGASRVAISKTDYAAYGCLYQWGRGNDGHQNITWESATTGTPINGSTITLSTTDRPANNLFIIVPTNPYDWRATANNNLWNGANRAASPNTPCPTGFRVPTDAELTAEFTAYSITGTGADDLAFASPHKFVLAGYRNDEDAVLYNIGTDGNLWSSTLNGNFARGSDFYASGSNSNNNNSRAYGFSVRCLKNVNF
jgi:hypothetical protein